MKSASVDRPRGRIYRQRGYVLLGLEVDRDVDATDVALHAWPISIDLTLPPRSARPWSLGGDRHE